MNIKMITHCDHGGLSAGRGKGEDLRSIIGRYKRQGHVKNSIGNGRKTKMEA